MLRVRNLSSKQLTPEMCRRMWKLRLDNIALRPSVQPEDDYAAFAKFFSNGTRAVTFWSGPDTLEGFYGWNTQPFRIDGQDFVGIIAEYAYLNVAYRGRPEYAFGGIPAAVFTRLANPRATLMLAGTAFPGSFIAMKLMSTRVITLQSPSITPAERTLLMAFAEEQGGDGFDPATGVVQMRTVPLPLPRERTPQRAVVREALAEFESYNPRWREGYGVPTLILLDWRMIANGVRRSIGQRARKNHARATRNWGQN